jgi:DNA-binding SARP family transcriptional activator
VRAAAADAVVASMIASRLPLPDVDHAWVDGLRQRAASVRTRALEVLVRVHLELGDYAMAEADASRLIAAEPFRETRYEVLMAAHLARGNAALGLRVYEQCRRLLADELGASPGPPIQAIYARLLAIT